MARQTAHTATSVLLNGERFPVLMIIDVNNLVFSRYPCVMRAKQERGNPPTRMNASVPQKSVHLYLFLFIYIYIRKYLLGGVYFFFLLDTFCGLPFGLPPKIDIGCHISPHRQHPCGFRPDTDIVSRTLHTPKPC